MTAADRLDAIEARANAATKGPWVREWYEDDPGEWAEGRTVAVQPSDDTPGRFVAESDTDPDAAFIAAARTDVPALAVALRAVLALHVDGGESQGFTQTAHGGYGYIDHCCAECGSFGEYGEPWPCPTVRAITAALDAS